MTKWVKWQILCTNGDLEQMSTSHKFETVSSYETSADSGIRDGSYTDPLSSHITRKIDSSCIQLVKYCLVAVVLTSHTVKSRMRGILYNLHNSRQKTMHLNITLN